MEYQFFTVDVFTEQPFNGAQIAVFPHAEGLDAKRMQLIAREFNLSETVFVFKPAGPGYTRRLRVFSPLREIDFGGHPVIAAVHVLAATGGIKLEGENTEMVLAQKAGNVKVNILRDRDQGTLIQFTMKSQPVIDRFVPMENQIAEMLSLDEKSIDKDKYHALMVSCGQPYLIVPIKSYPMVRKAKFNFDAWSQSIAPASLAREILLFSPHSDLSVSNFHARLIGPDIGFNEDPPIGSAMPAFTGYLCAHEHVKKGTYTFAIDRGTAATRRSVLNIEMDNNKNRENEIRIAGPAVMISYGEITIPG
ncbi:MAG: PhzF family phenazine biosynthesis protein [Gammaproteobacteria bacterium]